MGRLLIFLTLSFLLVGGAEAYEMNEAAKEVHLPLGDAQSGKSAFMEYRCYMCHRVDHDLDLPPLAGDIIGPILGPRVPRPETMLDQKRLEVQQSLRLPQVSYLTEKYAMSIIVPSHTIAPGFGKGDPEDEPATDMISFADVMTLTELRDIVTYLVSDENNLE